MFESDANAIPGTLASPSAVSACPRKRALPPTSTRSASCAADTPNPNRPAASITPLSAPAVAHAHVSAAGRKAPVLESPEKANAGAAALPAAARTWSSARTFPADTCSLSLGAAVPTPRRPAASKRARSAPAVLTPSASAPAENTPVSPSAAHARDGAPALPSYASIWSRARVFPPTSSVSAGSATFTPTRPCAFDPTSGTHCVSSADGYVSGATDVTVPFSLRGCASTEALDAARCTRTARVTSYVDVPS